MGTNALALRLTLTMSKKSTGDSTSFRIPDDLERYRSTQLYSTYENSKAILGSLTDAISKLGFKTDNKIQWVRIFMMAVMVLVAIYSHFFHRDVKEFRQEAIMCVTFYFAVNIVMCMMDILLLHNSFLIIRHKISNEMMLIGLLMDKSNGDVTLEIRNLRGTKKVKITKNVASYFCENGFLETNVLVSDFMGLYKSYEYNHQKSE